MRDVPPAEVMLLNNHLLNYAKALMIPMAGSSPDYVMRPRARRVKGKGEVKFCRALILIFLPVKQSSGKSAEDAYAATLAAFKRRGRWSYSFRKYSEMQLAEETWMQLEEQFRMLLNTILL